MLTGSGPGAGKSTLAARLEAALRELGVAVRLVPEEALFEWDVFAPLADRFRRRDFPRPNDLITAFGEVRRASGAGALWLQDWSWIDLAEDLPWAVHDAGALHDYSRRLHGAALPLRPLVLYLRADIRLALGLAIRQRGGRWLVRQGKNLGGAAGRVLSLDEIVAHYASREPGLRRAYDAGGWRVTELDAHTDGDRVLAAALAALRA